jgi:hypothetical protein
MPDWFWVFALSFVQTVCAYRRLRTIATLCPVWQLQFWRLAELPSAERPPLRAHILKKFRVFS